jgi:biopolymer transport protein ExbD
MSPLSPSMLPRHTKSMKLFCSIDTAALASVMVVLAFIVLFAFWLGPFPYHHSSGVDLPHASHAISMPGANREDAMIISILRDGNVYFGADKVDSDRLRSAIILHLKASGVERKLYIKADHRAHYGAIKEILDVVRDAGVEKIAFIVNQRRLPKVSVTNAVASRP